MAENVLSLNKTEEKVRAQEKVESFMMRNRKLLLAVIAVVVVAAVAVCAVFGIVDTLRQKDLAALDAIEYTYTKNAASIEASDLSLRQDAAVEALKPYLAKSGIVGVRANMLAGDIFFSKKDYLNSRDYWLKAARSGEKFYTAAICYYNGGVCAEELGDNENAATYYETASAKENFYLAPHALFSLGRVAEAMSDFARAKDSYQKIIDTYSGDDFAKLAHSRIISLTAEGKLN